MPSGDEIQRYLIGSLRLMTGKADGLRLLDLSIDGFWTSFYAILVAAPALLVSWVPLASELAGADAGFALRFAMLVRLAIVDVCAWVLPLAGLAAIASYAGIKDRFIQYVVASNWGSVLFAWLMLPASLMRLVWPASDDVANSLSLVIFLATLVLSWRLTNAVLAKGPAIASGVFAGTLVASILVLFAMQDLLGIIPLQ